MRKLSEVCKITGVTRRALQEYDRIGLISPTGKTNAGYWLYDDEAVKTIMLIQIFVEAGYERKEIKTVLERPDILDEIKKTIYKLEAKKKRIDGMINNLNMFISLEKLPLSTITALSNIDLSMLSRVNGVSFRDNLETSISHAASITEDQKKEIELYFPSMYLFLAIGLNVGKDPKSELVQNCVNDLYEYMINLEEIADPEIDWYDEEVLDGMCEALLEMLNDPEIEETINSQTKDGVVEYIIEAIEIFRDNHINKEGNE